MQTKNKNKLMRVIILILLILLTNIHFVLASTETEIDDINTQIADQQKKVDELKKQANVYLDNIQRKQQESVTLQNQLSILENKIAKSEIDIQTTEQEIEKTGLEIKDVKLQIDNRSQDIVRKNDELREFIRMIDKTDKKGTLEILLLNESISEFFTQVNNTGSIQEQLQNTLVSVKASKKQLEEKQEFLNTKQTDLETLKTRAEQQKIDLQEELQTKQYLIDETKNSEETFYNLYWQTKQEQQNASSEIYNLEREARKKLEELEKKSKETGQTDPGYIPLTDATLMWPVKDLSRGLSTYFHDPEYPFRYLFEHPGVDVRAYQGTNLYAAGDGYVIKAKDNGYGYSYITVMHAKGLSTVYGHVSKIMVKEDQYVTKGQIIGQSGGMPGTMGAGNLTTGPHLHFEVRMNGIPVNPLNYLPNMGF
ncbi:MAG: murein hydrolase activator EnvC family protein [Patescibacteria group bacterium]